jgi:hypothetical protein
VRARWESLHAALIRSVTTLPAATQYQTLRRGEPILDRFGDVEALLTYLASKRGDRDDKDQIYAALVRAVQSRAPCARVAGELAWCGLWPALDRIYRRRLYLGEEADELTQLIWLAFTELMSRVDLAHVQRIAATLVRSTDRDVGLSRLRLVRDVASASAAPTMDATAAIREPAKATSDDRVTSNLSSAGELADLRAQLVPLVGADADLIIAVLVREVDAHEAAARAGLTYAAARKRVQRAVLRIRAGWRSADGSDLVGRSPDPLVNRPSPETGEKDD